MDQPATQPPCDASQEMPTREELQAELVDIPEPPEPPNPIEPPGLEYVLDVALTHIRGRRGGDLQAILLVGSGARRFITPHSDIDLIAVIKGEEEREEMIRIADRQVEIRYRGEKAIEQEIPYTPRLPPLLRKARVLFEHNAVGTKLVEKAAQRFRQGPPPSTLNEKIRLKAQCLHWLGKAQDLIDQPATAHYLLGILGDDMVHAFFRLRGLWLTSPSDTLRFISSRDSTMGNLLSQFMTAPTLDQKLYVGRQLTDFLFKDVPNLPRVD